jgi:hypothetical protein
VQTTARQAAEAAARGVPPGGPRVFPMAPPMDGG